MGVSGETGHVVASGNAAGSAIGNQQVLATAGLRGNPSFAVSGPAPSAPSFQSMTPSSSQDAATAALLLNPHAAAHAAAAAMAAAAAHQMAQQHAQAQHQTGNGQTLSPNTSDSSSIPNSCSSGPGIKSTQGFFQDQRAQRDGAAIERNPQHPPLLHSSAPVGAVPTQAITQINSNGSNVSSGALSGGNASQAVVPSPNVATPAPAAHGQQGTSPLTSATHQLALSQAAAILAASNPQAFQGGVMNHAAIIPVAAALMQSAQQQAQQQQVQQQQAQQQQAQQQQAPSQQNQTAAAQAAVAALAASAQSLPHQLQQQQQQQQNQCHPAQQPLSQKQPHYSTQAPPPSSAAPPYPTPPSQPVTGIMQPPSQPPPAPSPHQSQMIRATSTAQAQPAAASPVPGLTNHAVAAAAAAHAVAAAAAASQARSPAPSASTPIPQHQPRRAPPASALVNNVTGTNPTGAAVVANAATKQAAGAAAAAATPLMLASMQNWKLEQLEAHVQLLRDAGQMIPQPVAVLLAEARRREEKRTAKRVANRKSACTSRARKKALVEEMTRTNARLRRQALILALLPDLVVAITIKGEITFCSAQVERVLRHKIDDLTGANISDILVPASRDALRRLIDELVAAERAAAFSAAGMGDENGGNGSTSADGGNDDPAVVSVQSDQSLSFPLSVVNVKNRTSQSGGDSDSSGANKANNGNSVSAFGMRSCRDGDQQHVSKDDTGHQQEESVRSDGAVVSSQQKQSAIGSPQRHQNRGLSTESSLSSSDDKNLRKANDALSQNVRWHNAKLKVDSGNQTAEHTDDVTGASVTANNADARLSSLQHKPQLDKKNNSTDRPASSKKNNSSKKSSDRNNSSALTYESNEENSSNSSDSLLAGVEENNRGKCSSAPQRNVQNGARNSNPSGNLSEDSGYRESGESVPSREDTSSSASDASSNSRNGRSKPLAPTCNVCLIREDLTTIWCEVTSSIRTRSLEDEMTNPATSTNATDTKKVNGPACNKNGSKSSSNSLDSSQPPTANEMKELLLCLRPIRDGEEKVGEELRFVPLRKRIKLEGQGSTELIAPSSVPPAISSSNVTISTKQTSNSRDDADSGGSSITGSGASSNNDGSRKLQGPMKKRMFLMEAGQKISLKSKDNPDSQQLKQAEKKRRIASLHDQTTDTEKSVVESLMLMSSNEL